MAQDITRQGSVRPTPAPRAGSARSRTALVVALAALAGVLSGCSGDRLEPAGSSSPEDLAHIELASTIRDRVTDNEVVVHGIVTNYPVPASAQAPDGARTLVLVDLTVTTGAERPLEVGPSSFQLRSGAGAPLLALTTADAALADSTFWPLAAQSGGRGQRGWVAFPLEWDTLEGAELVLVRPRTAVDPGGEGNAEFSVPLGIG